MSDTNMLVPGVAQPVAAASVLTPDTLVDHENPKVVEAAEAVQRVAELGQAGQFKEAADLCVAICEHLDQPSIDPASPSVQFLTAYSRFLEQCMLGAAQSRLGATREALAAFQKAEAIGRNSLMSAAANAADPGMAIAMEIEIDFMAANALVLTVSQNIRDEEFRAAERRARQAADAFVAVVDKVRQSGIPDVLRNRYMAASSLQGSVAAFFGEFARAEAARQARDWESALDLYDRVEDMTIALGRQAAAMEMPVASETQSLLLNATLIPIARKRLEENRALVAEGEHKAAAARQDADSLNREMLAWKSALDALKQWSPKIDVHNNVDVQTTVSTLVQVTQVARQRAIEDLDALDAAVKAAPIEEDKKKAIEAQVAELKATKDSDSGFFQKLTGFAETAGKLLKGVESTLEPLGKIIAWVTPIAGAAMAMAGM